MPKPGPWIRNPFENPTQQQRTLPSGRAALSIALSDPYKQRFPTQRGKGLWLFLLHSITNGEPDHCRPLSASPRSTWLAPQRTVTPFQPLPSFFGENSFHGPGGKIRTASGKGPKRR